MNTRIRCFWGFLLVLACVVPSSRADDEPQKPKVIQKKVRQVQKQPRAIQKKPIQLQGARLIALPTIGRGGLNAVNLINNKQVQDELKLSDEQVAKLRAITQDHWQAIRAAFQEMKGLEPKERQKKLATKRAELTKQARTKILAAIDETQAKRLRQIELQQQGAAALKDKRVADALQLTEEQQTQIKAAFDEQQEKTSELFKKGAGQGNFRERFAKMAELRKETETKVLDTLNDSQKKRFEELKGKKFELKRRAFQIQPKAVRVKREA